MKIVIEIDDARFKDIRRIACVQLENYHFKTVEQIIANGTLLPKGHGRLIDADKLEPRDISPEAWYSPMWGFELVDIEDAPTIIEADKAESEVAE
jgi:hypothetical protein